MRAIILVGGEGTRLRPLTINRLKGMVTMAGHPFLKYQFEFLKQHGVKNVTLSICHMPEKIKSTYGDGRAFGLRLNYAVEKKPLGTAGAIKNAQVLFPSRDHEPVVVMNGDILTAINLTRMLEQHRRKKAVLSIGLTWVEDPSAYGVVQFNQDKRIRKFIEKPAPSEDVSHWINAGVYLFSPGAFAAIPEGINYSAERALFPGLLADRQRLWAFPDRGYWNDIGTPQKYLQSNIDILEGRMFMLKVGQAFKGKAHVRLGKQCRIHGSVELVAPCVIDDHCTMENDILISQATVIGSHVHIGSHTQIARSVVGDQVHIGSSAFIEGAVIGSRSKIGKHVSISAGTVLADRSVVPDYSWL